MKLGDVVSALVAPALAEAAFVIAAAAFLAVVVTTFLRKNRGPFEQARLLPLADEAVGDEAQPPNRNHSRSSDPAHP